MLTDKIVQFLSIIQKAEENGIKDPSFEIQEVTELRDERKVSINKRI